jgi:hypothetical protein
MRIDEGNQNSDATAVSMRSAASHTRRNRFCATPNPFADANVGVPAQEENYLAATLLDLAAGSRSSAVRQPVLSWALCLYMQAVIAGMFGNSELHSRYASPVHICFASALKAKLELDDSAEKETAKASTRPAWRRVFEKDAVMVGSSGNRGVAARC